MQKLRTSQMRAHNTLKEKRVVEGLARVVECKHEMRVLCRINHGLHNRFLLQSGACRVQNAPNDMRT